MASSRRENRKSTAEDDYRILTALAKGQYKKEMDQFVSLPENTETTTLQNFHEKVVHTVLERATETISLSSSQKLEIKQELDLLFANYLQPREDASTPSVLIKSATLHYKKLMDTYTMTPTNIAETVLNEYHQQASTSSIEMIRETVLLNNHQQEKILESLNTCFKDYQSINSMKKESSAPAIGIDLGTTFCYIAVFRNSKEPEIIPSETGKNFIPSYIAFPNKENMDEDEVDDDDSHEESSAITVGETAKDLAHENLKYTIFDVKRMLGRKFSDKYLQIESLVWPFDLVAVDGSGSLKIKTGNDSYHSPLELTALLLQHLKELADNYLNANVLSAVVAVPAYYNSEQRKLTIEACKRAGINVLRLVTEPAAAAVAYSIHKSNNLSTEKIMKNCLIFDFGGGTLDVAVLAIGSNQIQVKSVKGDPHLGGQDIDMNMVNYCLEQFKEIHGIDIIQEKKSATPENQLKIWKRLRRLKLKCEEQKRYLSHSEQQLISLEAMHGGIDLVVPISRACFNSINEELFERSIKVMKEALEKSKLEKSDIDEVVLVGGTCRIPRLREMVSEFFNGKNLCLSVDTDEAVARGAAILAYCAENVEIPNVLIQQSGTGSFDSESELKEMDVPTKELTAGEEDEVFKDVEEKQGIVEAEENISKDVQELERNCTEEKETKEEDDKGGIAKNENLRPEVMKKARSKAAEKKRREEAEKAEKQAAAEKARREAPLVARREAVERFRRQAALKAKKEAEEKAQREAKEKAQREAEEKAQREAEENAKREAEEKAKRENEEKEQREAEEKAQREAEEKAQREAEEEAQREAEEKAQREAEEKLREETAKKLQRKAEIKALRDAAEKFGRQVAEKFERQAAEKLRRQETEKLQKEEAEKLQKEEAEKVQKEAAEKLQAQKEKISTSKNVAFGHLNSNHFKEELDPEIGIGMYLDENVCKIGIYNQVKPNENESRPCSSNPFIEILSVSPEICFYKNQIFIGQTASCYSSTKDEMYRYLNIFQLISSPNVLESYNALMMNNTPLVLRCHEVVAVFFSHLLQQIQKHEFFRNGYKTIKIFFTTPFTPTSAAKEIIQSSLRLAGFSNVRIFSSLIPLAISGAWEYFYTVPRNSTKKLASKLVFVIDVQSSYFSMGIVNMSQSAITVINPYGSDNLSKNENFSKWHSNFYRGETLTYREKCQIADIYEKSVRYVLTDISCINCLVISDAKRNAVDFVYTIISLVVADVWNKSELAIPLVGNSFSGVAKLASLLANKNKKLPYLCKNIPVHDSSRSDIRLVVGGNSEVYYTKSQHFGANPVMFMKHCAIPRPQNGKGTVIIELFELYNSELYGSSVGCYELSYKCGDGNSALKRLFSKKAQVNFNLKVLFDDNGIYYLKAEALQNVDRLMLKRLDCSNSYAACLAPTSWEYMKVMKFFQPVFT